MTRACESCGEPHSFSTLLPGWKASGKALLCPACAKPRRSDAALLFSEPEPKPEPEVVRRYAGRMH